MLGRNGNTAAPREDDVRLQRRLTGYGMTRMMGARGSPRVHLDGAEEEGFPGADHPANTVDNTNRKKKKGGNKDSKEPAALDANRLRRLSFGGGSGGGGGGGDGKGDGGLKNSFPPALDRTKESRRASGAPLVPPPLERPKYHHGEHRKRLPKVSNNRILYCFCGHYCTEVSTDASWMDTTMAKSKLASKETHGDAQFSSRWQHLTQCQYSYGSLCISRGV